MEFQLELDIFFRILLYTGNSKQTCKQLGY